MGQDFVWQDFPGQDFAWKDFVGQDFTGQDFTGQDFTEQDFTEQNFAGQNFAGQDFTDQEFAGQDFAEHNFANQDFADQDSADQDSADQRQLVSLVCTFLFSLRKLKSNYAGVELVSTSTWWCWHSSYSSNAGSLYQAPQYIIHRDRKCECSKKRSFHLPFFLITMWA